MSRNMYGATSADFTVTAGGRPVPSVELTIWDARIGGTQITDLLDVDSAACTTITSGADGSVVFYGPDGENDTLWLESGIGSRLATRPTVLTAEIADGSILDEDINAAADIGRSKIAGTALTTSSTGVFSVLDYGAVGDGTADDTAAIQAAITAGTGATVHFPPGRYKVTGTLTVPAFTALRGNVVEWGQGGTGYTELLFPATGTVTGIVCGAYAAIERLLLRGPSSGTSVGITGATVILRDMSVIDFYKGVVLTDAYYAVLDRVESSRNVFGLTLDGCYNVNLYGCRFSNNPDTANIAITTGGVHSLQMFGGSIENYTTAVSIDSGGGVHLFGVYFETSIPSPDKDIYGVLAYNKNGVSLLMTGCTIYLNGTDQFVYMNGVVNSVIVSQSNYFVSAASAGAVQAFELPTGASNQITLRDDNWMGVADAAISYVGGILNLGAVATAHIELPVGYTSGAWGADGATWDFHGRGIYLGDARNMAFGTTTGTKIGTDPGQKIAFYGATPIVRQTGVAVSAAGIHAALVALGLITA